VIDYIDSPGVCARKAARAAKPGEASPCARSIVTYCNEDLLDHIVLPSGMRLIRQGQHLRALELYRERLARRGRRATHTEASAS